MKYQRKDYLYVLLPFFIESTSQLQTIQYFKDFWATAPPPPPPSEVARIGCKIVLMNIRKVYGNLVWF